jgi:hypothetical protein
VWRHQVIPLLEEHYWGSGRDVAGEFGLAALRARIAAAADDSSDEEPPGDADDQA